MLKTRSSFILVPTEPSKQTYTKLEFIFKILLHRKLPRIDVKTGPQCPLISGLIKCLKQFRFQLRLNPSWVVALNPWKREGSVGSVFNVEKDLTRKIIWKIILKLSTCKCSIRAHILIVLKFAIVNPRSGGI